MIDRLVGLMILVISITVFLVARGYEAGFGDPLGPAVFPQMVAALAAILSLGMIFRPDANPEFRMDRARLKQAITLVVLIGYVLLLEPLGFPLATTLATTLLAMLFGGRTVHALATGLGTGIGLYLLFNNILGLTLPLAPGFIG